METLRFSLHFLRRQVRTTLRLPSSFFLSCFHPFVWMVLFGSLFQATASLRGFPGDSYVQYLAPGIAVMAALFGATYSGMGTLGDLQSGLLDKFLAAPVPRAAIIAGPLLNTALTTIVQAAIILATAMWMGARPSGGAGGLLLVFVVVGLLGSAFSALSHTLALLTRTQRTMVSVVNFISLPLVFMSSMMIARELMPWWMRTASYYNPVDWAVTASRAAFSGQLGPELWRPMGLLAVVTALAWLVAIRSLLHYQSTA